MLGVGPKIEVHPAFPRKINAEFVQVISPREIRMRVWERGSGETLACGTGACASAVAAVLNGLCERTVLCHLPGGDLTLEWSESGEVFMTGPATEVFSGVWNQAELLGCRAEPRSPEALRSRNRPSVPGARVR